MKSPLASTLQCNTRVRYIVRIRVWVWVKECVQGGGLFGGPRHLLGSFSDRVCFYAKNSWVHETLLEKQKRRREFRIKVRERRGDEDEPVAENRARNDSGKGSKLNFDLEKIE